MSPFCVVVFRVGIPTEAKPCSLGRSGSGYSNARRRCDIAVLNPGPHVLIALSPGMVWLSFPHHNGPDGRRPGPAGFSYGLLQFGKGYPLPAVVHLHRSVLPFADQGLALRRPIAPLPRLQLERTTIVADHPVMADRALGLKAENLPQFAGRRLPAVIVLRTRRRIGKA